MISWRSSKAPKLIPMRWFKWNLSQINKQEIVLRKFDFWGYSWGCLRIFRTFWGSSLKSLIIFRIPENLLKFVSVSRNPWESPRVLERLLKLKPLRVSEVSENLDRPKSLGSISIKAAVGQRVYQNLWGCCEKPQNLLKFLPLPRILRIYEISKSFSHALKVYPEFLEDLLNSLRAPEIPACPCCIWKYT